jgi:dehydrogenase/reductase SDR family protein 7B
MSWLSLGVCMVAVLVGMALTGHWLDSAFAREEVKGSKVIVTGASLGVGAALARQYAALGASEIVIAARNEARLNDVRASILAAYDNITVHVVRADLSNRQSSQALIQEALRLMGSLDYLILNHITNSRYGTWLVDNKNSPEGQSFVAEMFEVNLFSYIYAATSAIEHLRDSSGAIGIVSSLAGHVGVPKATVYAASKHALHGFFDSLRTELQYLRINNVGITLCAIGATDTEGAAPARMQMTGAVEWDSPDDAARAIILGVAARKRNIYHPFHKLYPVVFLYEYVPWLVDLILISVLK